MTEPDCRRSKPYIAEGGPGDPPQEKRPMGDEEYLTTQQQIVLLAGTVQLMDLAGFARRLDVADMLGPLLDPTLRGRAKDGVQALRDLVEPLMEFQAAANRIAGAAVPCGEEEPKPVPGGRPKRDDPR